MEREFNDQELVRRAKADDLRAKGIDPYGQAFERNANSKSIRDDYDVFNKEELEAKNIEVRIAGRIMSKRRMGKMCFMHILDILFLVGIEIVSEIRFTISLRYEILGRKSCDIGNSYGVGSQICNETCCSSSLDINTFIELLGYHHSLLGVEVKPVPRFLLHTARRKRR